MTRSISILLLLVFLTLGLSAQVSEATPPNITKQSIEGTLRDQNTDSPLPFGKVAIYQDDQLIAGEDTDMGGNYKIINLKPGNYTVKASYYGYDFIAITDVVLKKDSPTILDLDMKQDQALYEPIQIVAREVEKRIHKTICYGMTRITSLPSLEQKAENPSDKSNILQRTLPKPSEKAPTKPEKELFLYPNPSTGVVNIELDFETLSIQMVNTIGQRMAEVSYTELEKDKVQIDINQYPAGTYFLEFIHEEGTQVEKVILVRP